MTHNTTKQKTVLITGANNPEGIGAAIAKSFHNSGFKVILHGYSDPADMDGLIMYLSSNDASRYVTEATFTIDGGMSWGGL